MPTERQNDGIRSWHQSGKYGRYSTGPENRAASLLWIALWAVAILATLYALLR